MALPDIVYGLVSENHKVERRILISRTLQVYRLTTRRFHIASTGSSGSRLFSHLLESLYGRVELLGASEGPVGSLKSLSYPVVPSDVSEDPAAD
jgi:hypothetical protein